MVSVTDVAILSVSAFLGNVGVALTGFGMAIIYLFVWQIAVLSGYDSDFKYAIFIQALALFSAQPLLLYKAEIREHASRKMLLYFIPVTIISTPLGSILGDRVSTDLVEAIGGVLVTFVAVFEMYQKRELFVHWFCRCLLKKAEKAVETTSEELVEVNEQATDHSDSHHRNSPRLAVSFSTVFDLDKKLGEGAFSIVREGSHKESGLSYAIKIVIRSGLLGEEEIRLKREIAILTDLKHKNIVRLHEVFDEPESYFLVTEMMSGGDLLGRLEDVSFFGERQARRICQSVLEAVSYMHSKKVAHRDLKPENLLLDSDKDNAVVKIADYGFAKREEKPNSFTTMCGTPAYVAPEIISAVPYGMKVDLWSVGIITYILLAGYQPFRGDDGDTLKRGILYGDFTFDSKFWSNISNEAKAFITNVLTVNPDKRLSAEEARAQAWFSLKDIRSAAAGTTDNAVPVFFMVGSQRSGSNWLRTMVDEREDLVGPHPPHIMRDFMPIIDKFGDLEDDSKLLVLVDHVCTFVERNQVPWTDKHGANIKFSRAAVLATATASCERIRAVRREGGDREPLQRGFYLLGIFDAIMNFFTRQNGKKLWMCKSMGMTKFHDLLLEFYGDKRLRYIYLVRDPRDVAMSFMKTPVGDCHYHAISAKWTNLQGHALRVVEECPDLVHKVHYESILQDKATVVSGVYDFIGERRFGGVKRQASVMFMRPTVDLIDGAKKGREAHKARCLSSQFQNLGRGDSFANRQNKKWADPETGLDKEALQLIESVAHEMMKRLGYDPSLVGVLAEATVFTEGDLKHFDELNKLGIEKMNQDLQKENPGDFNRRQHQAETLNFPPILLDEGDSYSAAGDSYTTDGHESLFDMSFHDLDFDGRLETVAESVIELHDGRCFRAATATQRGYYPDEPEKPNQDETKIQVGILNSGSVHWFSVFDGHGPDGHKCSELASQKIPELFLCECDTSGGDIKAALNTAHMDTHKVMLADPTIDSSQSGTTAVTLLLGNDNKCFISNVGDSACILGSRTSYGATVAKPLCTEQTPFRADERERIKKAGGLIMTVDQRDGLVPINEDWDRSEPPPRIWTNRNDKFPGCGFTRSIGDSVAHTIGVTARPEIFEHTLAKNDCVLIVASDGVTEWMDEATCVEIACSFQDPAEAAQALIEEASRRWIDEGDYMDDITAIVVFLDQPSSEEAAPEVADHDHAAVDPPADIDLEACQVTAGEEPAADNDSNVIDNQKLGISAIFWTLFAGATSGFLGGLSGIRGPPIILYFLHPPFPVSFTKNTQRATGACITFTNVAMRVAYYLVDTLAFDGEDYFDTSDWSLYVSIVVCSILGVLVGSKLFEYVKDSKATVRGILSIFLLLCGVSLLLSSFAEV